MGRSIDDSSHRLCSAWNRTPILFNKERKLKQNMDHVRQKADAAFKKEERARDGIKARQEYESAGMAIREKTARLKSLRMAKEAAGDGKK